MANSLNTAQLQAYDAVVDSVENKLGKLFFLYGPRGTGKTYVYRTIIFKLQSTNKVVLPVASSGIAALLLPRGRTAYSRFKIPLELTEDSMCPISRGALLAQLLVKVDLIIWDEAPMAHKHTIVAVDRTLRYILSETDPFAKEKPFGEKSSLARRRISADSVCHPTRNKRDIVFALISQSHIWGACEMLLLQQNMRLAHSETEFAAWLLSVGEGTTQAGT